MRALFKIFHKFSFFHYFKIDNYEDKFKLDLLKKIM